MTVHTRRKPNVILTLVLPVVVLIGSVGMGADIVSLSLRPLWNLNIQFPTILSVIHWVVPALAVVIWLLLWRRFPYLSALFVVLSCVLMLQGVIWYADSRLDRVPTTRFLTTMEQQHLSFPIFQQGDSEGEAIFIEKSPARLQQLTEELRRLNVLRSAPPNHPATQPKAPG